MKINCTLLKIYILLCIVSHIDSTSIHASVGATASYTLARAAAMHVPSMLSRTDSAFAPNSDTIFGSQYLAEKYKKFPSYTAPNKLPLKPAQEIAHPQILEKNNPQSHHEILMSDVLTTEQKMEYFNQKFKDETEEFKFKLSEYWIALETAYNEYVHNQDEKIELPVDAEKPAIDNKIMMQINREKVLENIKIVTEKVFDPLDQRPLFVYIAEIKDLSKNLDPEVDGQIIDAINFLYENQHRSSILWDTAFWIQAIREKKLHEIPKKLNIKPFPKETILSELSKKSNIK